MNELAMRNRQRARRIDFLLLRRIIRTLLEDFAGVNNYELCFHLVAAPEMTRLNEQFLHHVGSTDVITFDHSVHAIHNTQHALRGEIFVCVDEAISQARRFRTTWQSEIVRYAVHGVLHLLGHDDVRPGARARMKREENRLLRRVTKQFPLARLAR